MQKSKTHRGFAITSFEDRNGVSCSIQKSSLATEDAIWIGCNDPGVKRCPRDNTGWHDVDLAAIFPGQDVVVNTRMHLTRDQVKELLPILRHFAKTGELP